MNTVLLSVSESTLLHMVAAKRPDESLDEAIKRWIPSRQSVSIPAQAAVMPSLIAEPRVRPGVSGSGKPVSGFGRHQLVMLGQVFACPEMLDVWRSFMQQLLGLVPDKVEDLIAFRFTKRRILARSKSDLYHGREDLRAEVIAPDLWIPTNCGKRDIIRSICAACDVVGLIFGKDVSVTFA